MFLHFSVVIVIFVNHIISSKVRFLVIVEVASDGKTNVLHVKRMHLEGPVHEVVLKNSTILLKESKCTFTSRNSYRNF